MAPIVVRDGTTIPKAIRQTKDVFGSIPLPNVEPLTTQAYQLLGRIDQKLMLHLPRPKPRAVVHHRSRLAGHPVNQPGPQPTARPKGEKLKPRLPQELANRPQWTHPTKQDASEISDFLVAKKKDVFLDLRCWPLKKKERV